MSVTDLHFRGTKFDELMDTSALSNFNILCSDPKSRSEFMDQIEMMTLVVSSKENVTNNHADDCDGSNHCFLGEKLWLAWDRIEGKALGFQDVDRDHLTGPAAFDMMTFLEMPSSRWFIVKENETLFLPGSMAHKVITLEHYIGVGSFHVTLPGYIRSLRRWILYDTIDISPKKLLEKINQAVLWRIRQLRGATRCAKDYWGVCYMNTAIELWAKREGCEAKHLLLENPTFASFYKAALEV